MERIYIKSLNDVKELEPQSSLILGNFDGVHIGHSQLISFARQNTKGKLGILTFSKSLKREGDYLTNIDDKIEYLEELGVDFIVILDANEELKETNYKDFVEYYLKKLKAYKIFCGPDFKYGYKAQGDVCYLKNVFPNLCVLNFVLDHKGDKIASTIIRKQIEEGDVKEANRHLGHKYRIKGKVIKGKGIGKELGFPTANIQLDFNYCLPKNGVYLTYIKIGDKIYESLTNVGVSPTIKDDGKITIETYIFDFHSSIYDKNVKVYFIDKIRNEYKFDSVKSLVEQMEVDLKEAYSYFDNLKTH